MIDNRDFKAHPPSCFRKKAGGQGFHFDFDELPSGLSLRVEDSRVVIGRKMGASPPQAGKTAINGVKTSVRKEIKMLGSQKISLLTTCREPPGRATG